MLTLCVITFFSKEGCFMFQIIFCLFEEKIESLLIKILGCCNDSIQQKWLIVFLQEEWILQQFVKIIWNDLRNCYKRFSTLSSERLSGFWEDPYPCSDKNHHGTYKNNLENVDIHHQYYKKWLFLQCQLRKKECY